MFESLTLGVIGSLLGTFAFLFLNSYWRGLVMPKLEDLVYKGVRVDGKWQYEHRLNDKEKQIYTLELKQRADRLNGTMTLTSDITEGTSSTSGSFSGYIADGFVIGSARPNTPDSMWHTTYCLRVVEDLDCVSLKGVIGGMALHGNPISSWNVHFKKKNG